ncbi:Leucine--tRNA ligase OS=Streptomyces antimycoticus OX=68175 GN=leuS PE=3 SV=1 [Streptomyces antimycoticus]
MLPLKLPEVEDYLAAHLRPGRRRHPPETPLSRNADWVNVALDLGDGRARPYRRETNTMPNWARFLLVRAALPGPANSERLVDPETERYWMGPREGQPHGGVDLYVGGSEHAVLHLLYARFWSRCCSTWGMSPRSSRSTSCTTRA